MTIDLIAVKSLPPSGIGKGELLLFSRIAIPKLDSQLDKITDDAVLADLLYLKEAQILFEPTRDSFEEFLEGKAFLDGETENYANIVYTSLLEEIRDLCSVVQFEDSELEKEFDLLKGTIEQLEAEEFSKIWVRLLDILPNVRAVPLLDKSPMTNEYWASQYLFICGMLKGFKGAAQKTDAWDQDRKTKHFIVEGVHSMYGEKLAAAIHAEQNPEERKDAGDVVQIVLNEIPIPDDSVSLQQLVEFRNDPETKNRSHDLRLWMSKIARQNLPKKEIEEELQDCLSQYERHMRIHKMKHSPGAMETSITIASEMIESIVKLNFKSTAKQLFTIRHRRLAMLEAEQTAPGKEVAFVFHAKRQTWKN